MIDTYTSTQLVTSVLGLLNAKLQRRLLEKQNHTLLQSPIEIKEMITPVLNDVMQEILYLSNQAPKKTTDGIMGLLRTTQTNISLLQQRDQSTIEGELAYVGYRPKKLFLNEMYHCTTQALNNAGRAYNLLPLRFSSDLVGYLRQEVLECYAEFGEITTQTFSNSAADSPIRNLSKALAKAQEVFVIKV
jgi:hypothetical protein